MTGFEIFLLVMGGIMMLGSFFVAERLSMGEVKKIAELSNDEINRILEKHIEGSQKRVEEMVDDTIDNSMEIVEQALDKETNSKMMALSEYSDTVMEEANKTHNEIMFLYNMLNDKHTELTNFAGELQDMMGQMQRMEADFLKNIVKPMEENLQQRSQAMEMAKKHVEKQQRPVMELPKESLDAEANLNRSILELHNKGMSNVQIAKELNIGLGEVQLVIGLYMGEGRA